MENELVVRILTRDVIERRDDSTYFYFSAASVLKSVKVGLLIFISMQKRNKHRQTFETNYVIFLEPVPQISLKFLKFRFLFALHTPGHFSNV